VIPTRWQARLEDQLADAEERLARARAHLADDGSRALQAAYQAVVSAATLCVWLEARVWEAAVPPGELPARVQQRFPSLFAALAALDLRQALTSPWTVDAVRPYVTEASAFVEDAAAELRRWLTDG